MAVKLGLSPLVDAATLTGAIVVALGQAARGPLQQRRGACSPGLVAAAEIAGERLWPMPMDAEYERADSQRDRRYEADRRTRRRLDRGGEGAGNFAEGTPWAHLDIAGVAWRDHREAEGDKGATGFGVRIFAELATLLAERRSARVP